MTRPQGTTCISIKALRLYEQHGLLKPLRTAQERVLAKDSERITRALALIRKAGIKLACGAVLSIDDLETLAQETVMTKSTAEELKEIPAPFTRVGDQGRELPFEDGAGE